MASSPSIRSRTFVVNRSGINFLSPGEKHAVYESLEPWEECKYAIRTQIYASPVKDFQEHWGKYDRTCLVCITQDHGSMSYYLKILDVAKNPPLIGDIRIFSGCRYIIMKKKDSRKQVLCFRGSKFLLSIMPMDTTHRSTTFRKLLKLICGLWKLKAERADTKGIDEIVRVILNKERPRRRGRSRGRRVDVNTSSSSSSSTLVGTSPYANGSSTSSSSSSSSTLVASPNQAINQARIVVPRARPPARTSRSPNAVPGGRRPARSNQSPNAVRRGRPPARISQSPVVVPHSRSPARISPSPIAVSRSPPYERTVPSFNLDLSPSRATPNRTLNGPGLTSTPIIRPAPQLHVDLSPSPIGMRNSRSRPSGNARARSSSSSSDSSTTTSTDQSYVSLPAMSNTV